jgi:hypothetical protein
MTMGRVEQYHTHTHIVYGYIILPVSVPMGVNLYPYPYSGGYPYPLGTQRVDQIVHKLLTILLSLVVHWGLEHGISISLLWGDLWITTNA